MVRRSNETAVTLQPTKDWRALEQIRWSKLERDNEMFKKIQKHRYMNIISSIQLEKSIKVKYYSRMEEKLNIRLDRLEGVKERYNILPKEVETKAKSCPIPEPLPPPPKSNASSSSDLSISTLSDNDMSKPVHPGAKEVEEEQEDMSPKHRAPNHEQLTLMVQNFLRPTKPLQDSLASAKEMNSSRERKRVVLTKTIKSNESKPRPLHQGQSNDRNVMNMKNRSFYLTTS